MASRADSWTVLVAILLSTVLLVGLIMTIVVVMMK